MTDNQKLGDMLVVAVQKRIDQFCEKHCKHKFTKNGVDDKCGSNCTLGLFLQEISKE